MENEFRSMFLGDLLGEGMSRKVYVIRGVDNAVIKIEDRSRYFQNIAEWEIWGWVKDTKMERWFAPCIDISNSGAILTQRRVFPMREKEKPTALPAYLCDLKSENFGVLDGRVVCCDYGTMLSAVRTMSGKMKKADWRA